MTAWTGDELRMIGEIEEIDIVTLDANGRPRKPVTIWVVRVGDGLYIRSARGLAGAWFQAAQAHPEGRILAGGLARDVSLVAETDPGTNDRIDTAYHAKYDPTWPQYVPPVVSPESRATTLRLVPRPAETPSQA